MSECASKGCGCTTEPIIQPTAPAPLATGSAQAVYRIENMDCSNEEKLIRSHLGAVGGVQGLDFDLRERTLSVKHLAQTRAQIEQVLSSIGMQAKEQISAGTGLAAAPASGGTNACRSGGLPGFDC